MADNSEVHVYVNNSDPKSAYKNLQNEVIITGSFRMKEPMDQLRPVFMLAKSTLETKGNWSSYNYCKIPRFGNRYYFMHTKTLSDGMIECTCEVDPLTTYIDKLAGMSFEIARYQNAALNNLYADDQQPIYANTALQWVIVGNLEESTAEGAKHYVMTVAGG